MKYTFGALDIDAAKTRRTPLFEAILKEPIKPIVLRDAVTTALEAFPIFKCRFVGKNTDKTALLNGQLGALDKKAFLETDAPLEPTIWHASIENRPVLGNFEKDNNNINYFNDALYQICWYENHITLEWLPLLTDTHVAMKFFSEVLSVYCEKAECLGSGESDCAIEAADYSAGDDAGNSSVSDTVVAADRAAGDGARKSSLSNTVVAADRAAGDDAGKSSVSDTVVAADRAAGDDAGNSSVSDTVVAADRAADIKTAERVFDASARPVGQVAEPEGYKREAVPILDKYTCHVMHFNVEDICRVSRKDNTSVMAVLVTVLARALSEAPTPGGVCGVKTDGAVGTPAGASAEGESSARPVSTDFYLDMRAEAGFETARVATYRKAITYEPRMNRYPISEVSTIYRHGIDIFKENENLRSYQPSSIGTNIDAEHAGELQPSDSLYNCLIDFRMMELPKNADAMLTSVLRQSTLTVCLTERFAEPVFDKFISICQDENMKPLIQENFFLQ